MNLSLLRNDLFVTESERVLITMRISNYESVQAFENAYAKILKIFIHSFNCYKKIVLSEFDLTEKNNSKIIRFKREYKNGCLLLLLRNWEIFGKM